MELIVLPSVPPVLSVSSVIYSEWTSETNLLTTFNSSGYSMYHQIPHPKILRSNHELCLCVLYGSHNKQWLFPYTELTDSPGFDRRSFRVTCGRSGTGQIFLPVLLFSPISVLPPMLHNYYLHVSLTKRTNGRNLRTFQKKLCSYENRRALDFHFFFGRHSDTWTPLWCTTALGCFSLRRPVTTLPLTAGTLTLNKLRATAYVAA